MGNSNIDAGRTSPTRKAGKPSVEQMKAAGQSEAGTSNQMQAGQSNCGAMSQQGSVSYQGNVSSPQQLLRLVGCRDPNVSLGAQIRGTPKRR